jgi:hypothetical protein
MASNHTEKWSTSEHMGNANLETRCHDTLIKMAKVQNTGAGKDVEQQNSCSLLVAIRNGITTLEVHLADSPQI